MSFHVNWCKFEEYEVEQVETMNAEESENVPQIEVKFFTRHQEYSVPDTIFSVPCNVGSSELSKLINSLLNENSHQSDGKQIEFDFLIAGELLRLPLKQYTEYKNLSLESVLEIEFIPCYPAPSPEQSLSCDDWVSAVRMCDKWILSGCYDNTLHIWSSTGEHRLTIPGHVAPIKSVAWVSVDEPIGVFISTSHDETAIIWQWDQYTNAIECIHVCRGHLRSVDCVDVSLLHRKFVTGSYDHTMKIWSLDLDDDDNTDENESRKKRKTVNGETKSKTPLLTLSGHTEAVSGVQWTDVNELCSSSMDNTISLWDVELGGLKSQLTGSKPFLAISYSPLSRHLVSASTDRHVRLWDPRIKDGTVVKCVFTSHNGWILDVHWSPTSEYQFISGSYDCLLKLWDTRSPKVPLYNLLGHEDKILCVDWSIPNKIASGGTDNHIKIFNT